MTPLPAVRSDTPFAHRCLPSFVRRYDEDLDDIKKARRPGRPPSAKEDMMKARISALEKEYEGGFCQYVRNTCFDGS